MHTRLQDRMLAIDPDSWEEASRVYDEGAGDSLVRGSLLLFQRLDVGYG